MRRDVLKRIILYVFIVVIITGCSISEIKNKADDSYEKFNEYTFDKKGFGVKIPEDYVVKEGLTKNLMLSNSKDRKRFLIIQRRMKPTREGMSAKSYYMKLIEAIKTYDSFQGEVLREEEVTIDKSDGYQGTIKFLGNNDLEGKYAVQLKTIIKTEKSIVDITLIAGEDDFDKYREEFILITNSFKEK